MPGVFPKGFDPHAVLGVPEGAPPEAIRQARRRLARLHHPDLSAAGAGAGERMKLVNLAADVLLNGQWARHRCRPPPCRGTPRRPACDETAWSPPPRTEPEPEPEPRAAQRPDPPPAARQRRWTGVAFASLRWAALALLVLGPLVAGLLASAGGGSGTAGYRSTYQPPVYRPPVFEPIRFEPWTPPPAYTPPSFDYESFMAEQRRLDREWKRLERQLRPAQPEPWTRIDPALFSATPTPPLADALAPPPPKAASRVIGGSTPAVARVIREIVAGAVPRRSPSAVSLR